jgi:hypothetical protein
LSHSTSPIFVKVFLKYGLENYLLRLASNHDLPDLCLLSSWDYRREPPTPSVVCSSDAGRRPLLALGECLVVLHRMLESGEAKGDLEIRGSP